MADSEIYHGSRPMPEFVKKGLIQIKGAGLYLKASYVVLWFRSEHPEWCIRTKIVAADENNATVKATVTDELGRVVATGHKSCSRAAFPGGHLEKAESGAVARALGFLGYGTEYGEVEATDAPAQALPRGGAEEPAASGPRVRPTAEANGPLLSTQEAAIRSLCKQKGLEVPAGLTSYTCAQAADLLRSLQERN